FIPWEEVDEVSFSPVNSWFVIQATDGWKFRVSLFVPGLSHFLEECERHLPFPALERAEQGYDRVGRPFPDPDDLPRGRRRARRRDGGGGPPGPALRPSPAQPAGGRQADAEQRYLAGDEQDQARVRDRHPASAAGPNRPRLTTTLAARPISI